MGNLENVKIVYSGFEATQEIRENILVVFKKLQDEAPYGAFVEVHLEKVESGVSGRVHVSSVVGEFKASAVEMTPQDAVDAISSNIRHQLIEWKSTRFSEAEDVALA